MSAIKIFLLLAFLCVFHPSPLCEAAVCYVKPTEPHNATCPSEPCHTLDEYVSNSTRYFVSNTVFIFLSGHHYHQGHLLNVSNVCNITLRPYIEKSHVVIHGRSSMPIKLWFELATDIVIRDMTLQAINIGFDRSANVTLTGLTVLDTGVVLNVQNANISNCYFDRSYCSASGASNSVLSLTGDVTFMNSHSCKGALAVSNCLLSLTGNVTFIGNHGVCNQAGGAISLFGDSRILIPEPASTYILFEKNIADDVGGAIYFSNSGLFVTGYCQIFVNNTTNKTVFNFIMNTAANGGNAIYGAYLDGSCYLHNGTSVRNLSQLILSVLSFLPSFEEDPSVITSNAKILCICNHGEEPGDCPEYHWFYFYPGQIFRLPVAALGDMKGFVKWPVRATVDQGEFSNEIQHSQNTNHERCTNLQYSILSKNKHALLSLSLGSHIGSSYDLIVGLLDCPLGFALSTNYGCDCHKNLSQNVDNITCNITEQSIQRQGTTWIGVLEKNTLGFSNICPFLFCNKSHATFFVNQTSILNAEVQCADNRSGVLCGGCKDNFSLVLGSNRCLQACSNKMFSLIIALAAVGIALVFFIKILNLTVSQGTINGLIFYANIVGAEQTLLFSSQTYFERFLSAFIAWMNLDLGIETCFFSGMDAYAKAWLQFVFPVYVWIITLFIITISHYSIRISRLFGNNSVPVLATLILLSYSKLLRAVISALSVTNIQFLNGSTMSVWERDGNIQYLTGKHIPLFVFAVAVLVLLWFPFTLTLVSIQWLQRGTHYRVLHWVTKLRPFFDAFTGPLKDKHRYWVGALLLARCSLLLVFYIYTSNGNGVAFISIMFATLLILVYLAGTGYVYKYCYLAVLELSYILNLGILATGTLYVWYVDSSGNQKALVMTSVGIAFLQFIAILIYHGHVQLRQPLKKLVLKLKMKLHACGEENVQYESLDGSEDEDCESIDEASYIHNGIRLQRPPFQEIELPSKDDEPLLVINN